MRLSHFLTAASLVACLMSGAWADELTSVDPSDGGLPALAQPSQATSTTSSPALASFTTQARALGQRALASTASVGEFALGLLGINYKFGGNDPSGGFDCSGLVRYVFQQVTGIALPHNAAAQSKEGRAVTLDELRPGDLVFFNTRRFAFSHVGIYLGDNKFVHAPRKGQPVQVVDFNLPYWQKAFNGARRLLEAAPDLLIPAALAQTLPTSVAPETTATEP